MASRGQLDGRELVPELVFLGLEIPERRGRRRNLDREAFAHGQPIAGDPCQLARVVAEAGKQLTQANQQQAAQKQAQQQQQDPMFQLQQQELQVKAQEVQRKTQKDAADIQIKQEEQKRKLAKDMADAQLDEQRLKLEKLEVGIDAKKAGVKMQADKRATSDKTEFEILKLATANKKEPS